MANQFKQVLVTGGAGYVGSRLVPKLLENGYKVNVLDLYIYGKDVFETYHDNPSLKEIVGDIRDQTAVRRAMEGCDAVIHLACISNDPSFDLNPELGRSINLDAFKPMLKIATEVNVKRFIYASSSSVYGIKNEKNVTEDLALEPLTDYSKFKADCEKILLDADLKGMEAVIIRPATVCGYSKRLRLDLTVNILSTHAFYNKKIKVFGGNQLRPNIHIEDMADAYLACLNADKQKVDRKIFNVGYQNHSVHDIALMVKECFGANIEIEFVHSDDNRSYHVSSEKIKNELGFEPKHTISDAVNDLKNAFENYALQTPLSNPVFYNIKQMQLIGLT